MAVDFFLDDLDIIAKMGDNPRDDGLTTHEFKEEFDKAGNLIKSFLNSVLIPAVNAINAGAIIMSEEQPSISPVLWIKTTQSTQELIYIDSVGTLRPLLPKTTIDQVEGLNEQTDEIKRTIGYVQVSLLQSNWNNVKPYMQTVHADGMTADWKAGYYTIVSNEDIADDLAMQEAAGCITKITTGDSIITFICGEDLPESDINIQIHGAMGVQVNGNNIT